MSTNKWIRTKTLMNAFRRTYSLVYLLFWKLHFNCSTLVMLKVYKIHMYYLLWVFCLWWNVSLCQRFVPFFFFLQICFFHVRNTSSYFYLNLVCWQSAMVRHFATDYYLLNFYTSNLLKCSCKDFGVVHVVIL